MTDACHVALTRDFRWQVVPDLPSGCDASCLNTVAKEECALLRTIEPLPLLAECDEARQAVDMTRPLVDSHFHIIEPRFPLVPNNGFIPSAFTVADYRAAVHGLGVVGGVVVSGSFQADDHGYLFDALPTLGSGFVGVANVAADASDKDLQSLAAAGIRAVRFNLYRSGSEGAEQLLHFGQRLWEIAHMHVELYVDAIDLAELAPTLTKLPMVSIDHLGMTDAHRATLLHLVEGGLRVKATGFGRVNLDIGAALRDIHAANPGALMFGTDAPGTRARRPFKVSDLALIEETLGENALAAVLHDNAAVFYRMRPTPSPIEPANVPPAYAA